MYHVTNRIFVLDRKTKVFPPCSYILKENLYGRKKRSGENTSYWMTLVLQNTVKYSSYAYIVDSNKRPGNTMGSSLSDSFSMGF